MGSRLSEPNTQDMVFSHYETAPPEWNGIGWTPMVRPICVPCSNLTYDSNGSMRNDNTFQYK